MHKTLTRELKEQSYYFRESLVVFRELTGAYYFW